MGPPGTRVRGNTLRGFESLTLRILELARDVMLGNFLKNNHNQHESVNFLVTGKEFINGVGVEAKEKVNAIYSDFSDELKIHSINTAFEKSIEEKNYGRGADWVLAAVEFLATNPYVKAASTTGGLITLGKHIASFFNKKREEGVFLGIDAGRMFAAAELSEEVNVKNISTLSQIEINRSDSGFDNREYLYVFGVNQYKYDVQDTANNDLYFRGDIYLVHLTWEGVVVNVTKY